MKNFSNRGLALGAFSVVALLAAQPVVGGGSEDEITPPDLLQTYGTSQPTFIAEGLLRADVNVVGDTASVTSPLLDYAATRELEFQLRQYLEEPNGSSGGRSGCLAPPSVDTHGIVSDLPVELDGWVFGRDVSLVGRIVSAKRGWSPYYRAIGLLTVIELEDVLVDRSGRLEGKAKALVLLPGGELTLGGRAFRSCDSYWPDVGLADRVLVDADWVDESTNAAAAFDLFRIDGGVFQERGYPHVVVGKLSKLSELRDAVEILRNRLRSRR